MLNKMYMLSNQSNSTESSSIRLTLYIDAAVTVFILIFAVFGNLVIITIYICFKQVRNMNNLVVTVSSMTDLLRAIVVMTIKTYNQLTLKDELIEPLCTITAITSAFTFVVSPLLLALIAFIRYNVIVPSITQRFRLTYKILYFMIAAIIATSSLFAILPMLGVGCYIYSIHHGVCFTPWIPRNLAFRVIIYILGVGISFPVLTVCYVKLFLLFRKHKHVMESNRKFPRITFTKTQSSTAISHERGSITMKVEIDITEERMSHIRANIDDESRKTSKIAMICKSKTEKNSTCTSNPNMAFSNKGFSQEYRTTTLMIIVFIAYCLCWIPATVVNIVALAKTNSVPDTWLIIIVTMTELNSALNPLIYGFGNRQYRKAFKKMTSRLNSMIQD